MGAGIEYNCEKCGNRYGVSLGIGMMFPDVYQKALEDIRNGKYGEEWKALATDNAYTAVNAELCFYKCGECGGWANEMDLSLYVPKDPEKIARKTYGSWSVAAHGCAPYVTDYELENDYALLRRYAHKCPKCGKEMRRIPDDKKLYDILDSLPCPRCGEANMGIPLMWD